MLIFQFCEHVSMSWLHDAMLCVVVHYPQILKFQQIKHKWLLTDFVAFDVFNKLVRIYRTLDVKGLLRRCLLGPLKFLMWNYRACRSGKSHALLDSGYRVRLYCSIMAQSHCTEPGTGAGAGSNGLPYNNIRSCKFHDGGSWRAARALVESCTSARGVLCANCYVQTGCANWYVQNDIFACNFLNNGPILIIFFLFESSWSPLSTPRALVQLHEHVELHEHSWSALAIFWLFGSPPPLRATSANNFDYDK